jgi:type I restriction enzyme, S subunit
MDRGPGVTTGRSGVLGNVFFTFEDFWPLNTSLWVKDFKIASPAFAYYLLQNIDFSIFATGSAVPTLNRNHIHTLPLKIPPSSLIKMFEENVIALLKYQKQNEINSEMLAELRDTLLPKLMSGQVRVRST